jgi:peptide chain release factor 3
MSDDFSQGPVGAKQRRTFAIISHPDAGKTTLTEKFLLLGGAIRLAGAVKSRKAKKFATSDWMELEKQRGISVSSSAMNFEYRDIVCNILDTPGHQDFSEDTYRTLAAADSAIMLLDGAKGVEPQTIKLFEVCKIRGIPVFTFINKMDRDTLDPFDLMHEIETVLGIRTFPMTWPVENGVRFKGVVERATRTLHYFQGRNVQTETLAEVIRLDNTERVDQIVNPAEKETLVESLEMLDIAGEQFNQADFENGRLTPVFFGSAMTNFGVRAFLEKFLTMAPGPGPKATNVGFVEPTDKTFTGFVFKIQANMDPRHRDRVAFLRVVSGTYEPGMMVWHSRLRREVKLTQPQQFFGQERSVVENAFPGDIVGMYDPGLFAIGDSLSQSGNVEFEGIPAFAPENFAVMRTTSALKRKQLMRGLVQLCQEGTVQMFVDESRAASDPVLAAVGSLQFDVLLFRLRNEYNVDCNLENLNYKHARWTDASDELVDAARAKTDCTAVRDMQGNLLFLFKNDFHLDYFQEHCPDVNLYRSNAKLAGNMMKSAASFFDAD